MNVVRAQVLRHTTLYIHTTLCIPLYCFMHSTTLYILPLHTNYFTTLYICRRSAAVSDAGAYGSVRLRYSLVWTVPERTRLSAYLSPPPRFIVPLPSIVAEQALTYAIVIAIAYFIAVDRRRNHDEISGRDHDEISIRNPDFIGAIREGRHRLRSDV